MKEVAKFIILAAIICLFNALVEPIGKGLIQIFSSIFTEWNIDYFEALYSIEKGLTVLNFGAFIALCIYFLKGKPVKSKN
ncbi:hypothetical protein [Clostridium sp. B9]|uniref:hypothetical protein n=1 Tax=Clostridium sp. B9 TaxID=3423224 RepID=UPI003D2F265A